MATLEVRQGEEGVFFLAGEFDMNAQAAFEPWIPVMCEGDGPVVLDLGALTFIDSTGIRAVLRVCVERPVVLRNAHDHIRRVFEITGLSARPEITLDV